MNSNIKTYTIFLFVLFLSFFSISESIAQPEMGYGFRAGLNYSKFRGDLETNEEFSFTNGFHIGVAFNFKFTDLFGVRTEVIFSQRGTEQNYNGDSYYLLGKGFDRELMITGNRDMTVNVSNGYFDIPITAYYRLGNFEVSGGLYGAILLGSAGGGSIDFDGVSPTSGLAIDPFRVRLQHNYKSDELLTADPFGTEVNVDGTTYMVPGSSGAYYEYASRDKNLYKTFDYGLIGGISYFVNEGLFLGFRITYGFADLDDDSYDRSLNSLDGTGNPIPRADKNSDTTMQFSIGFSF